MDVSRHMTVNLTRRDIQDLEGVPPNLTKITVNLIEAAYAALVHAATVTGLNKTNTVNRAVQCYDYLLRAQEQGRTVALIDESGNIERLTFL
jgi:hypothetical protein